ncbi:MAG TPA: hypothetical protein VFS92_02265 [Planctomycetota bacterium]|nr:hypothetical protein [Planctomycetota bacterium]
MRAIRAALRLLALGLAAGACSGLGTGACASGVSEGEAPPADDAVVRDGAAAADGVEARIRDLRARLDAARAIDGDFATEARRLRALRDEVLRLQSEVTDPERRRALGLEELALLVDAGYREFLEIRVPAERTARVRATLLELTAAPAATGGVDAFVAVRRRAAEFGKTGLRESLARLLLDEAEAVEFDTLLALDPSTLTEEQAERTKRLATRRRSALAEIEGALANSRPREFRESTYGAGTGFAVGSADGRAPDAEAVGAWWDSALATERAEWLECWLADRAGVVEALKVWDEPCGACGAMAPPVGGAEAPVPADRPGCRDCGGCGVIRKVRWR